MSGKIELPLSSGPGEGQQSVPPPSDDRGIFRRIWDSVSGALRMGRFRRSHREINVQSSDFLHSAEGASQPISTQNALQGAALSVMALEMHRSGAVLVEHHGRLEVKGRPRLFANLTRVSKKAPENARKFLELLQQAAKSAPKGSKNPEIEQAVDHFSRSEWFQAVLQEDKSLLLDLAETIDQISQPGVREKAEAVPEGDVSVPVPSPVHRSTVTEDDIFQRLLTEDGVTPSMARQLAHNWAVSGSGEQKKPIAYICPEIDAGRFGNVEKAHKMIRVTPEGIVEQLTYFEPNIDNEEGRRRLLERFPTSIWLEELSKAEDKGTLPKELKNDQMGECFYLVALDGEDASQKKTEEGLIGARSSGTLRALVASQKSTLISEIRVSIGVLQGLRFLHARGFVHLSVGMGDVEVVSGQGKLARGPFTHRHSALFEDYSSELDETTCYSASGLAPELLANNSKMRTPIDMFAFGAMLLQIMDPRGLKYDLQSAGLEAYEGEITFDNYTSRIRDIQERLRSEVGPQAELCKFIANLIDPDEAKRPDSTTAERQLQAIVQSWPQEEAKLP